MRQDSRYSQDSSAMRPGEVQSTPRPRPRLVTAVRPQPNGQPEEEPRAPLSTHVVPIDQNGSLGNAPIKTKGNRESKPSKWQVYHSYLHVIPATKKGRGHVQDTPQTYGDDSDEAPLSPRAQAAPDEASVEVAKPGKSAPLQLCVRLISPCLGTNAT